MSTIKPPIGATLNRSHPLARGLVGAWLLNEGGGDIAHNCANICPALDLNFYNHGVAWTPGDGGAVDFGGEADQDSAAMTPAIESTQHFTLLCRLRADAVSSVDGIVATRSPDGNGLICSSQSGYPLTYMWGGSGWNLSTGLFFDDDEWHQAAMVITPTVGYVWLDQNVYANTQSHSAKAFTGRWEVGRDPGYSSGRWFDGQVSCVMMWQRALPVSEIRDLYRNPYAMFERRRTLYVPAGTTTGTPYYYHRRFAA